jgi:hypothetical protein
MSGNSSASERSGDHSRGAATEAPAVCPVGADRSEVGNGTILASPLSGKFARMLSISTTLLMWTLVIFDVLLRKPLHIE